MKDLIRAALASHDLITTSQAFCAAGVEHAGDQRWIHLYEVGVLDLDDGHWTLTDEDSIGPIEVDELAERIASIYRRPTLDRLQEVH